MLTRDWPWLVALTTLLFLPDLAVYGLVVFVVASTLVLWRQPTPAPDRFRVLLDELRHLENEPQDASWPGERTVICTHHEDTTADLQHALTVVHGLNALSPTELVVTDIGVSRISEHDLVRAAAGYCGTEGLVARGVAAGADLLVLPREWIKHHPATLRRLLWLLPHECTYVLVHEECARLLRNGDDAVVVGVGDVNEVVVTRDRDRVEEAAELAT